MRLEIGSNTTGGTGYLTRVIKAAQTNDHIDIVVLTGAQQLTVVNKISEQLTMLHAVADVHFTHTLTTT